MCSVLAQPVLKIDLVGLVARDGGDEGKIRVISQTIGPFVGEEEIRVVVSAAEEEGYGGDELPGLESLLFVGVDEGAERGDAGAGSDEEFGRYVGLGFGGGGEHCFARWLGGLGGEAAVCTMDDIQGAAG